MSPVCFKEKGKFLSNRKSPKCGPNTFIDANGICFCKLGFFESETGDAKSTVGCKDPCNRDLCLGPNTYCLPISARDVICLCTENFVPKNGSAMSYGCEQNS